MAIDSISTNSYQYTKPAFLGLTGENVKTASYQGRYQGVPSTTPQVDWNNSDLIEQANLFAESKIASGNIFETKKVSTPQNAKGAQWDGFSVPENNGTGELRPSHEGNYDTFCYMA